MLIICECFFEKVPITPSSLSGIEVTGNRHKIGHL